MISDGFLKSKRLENKVDSLSIVLMYLKEVRVKQYTTSKIVYFFQYFCYLILLGINIFQYMLTIL
jgi:hypothetical protein